MDAIVDDEQQRALLKRRIEKVFSFLIALTPRINVVEGVVLDTLPLCDRTQLTDRERQLLVVNARFALRAEYQMLQDVATELLPLLTMLTGNGYSIDDDFRLTDPDGNPVERYQKPV